MTDEEIFLETNVPTGPSQGIGPSAVGAAEPLVAVTFQKNPHRQQKYLEAMPKALGVTQITLSVNQLCSFTFFNVTQKMFSAINIINAIGPVLIVVAGILALAAQNLHLPTLKACLGMQVVACVFSIFNLFDIMANLSMLVPPMQCWDQSHFMEHDNSTEDYSKTCILLEDSLLRYNGVSILVLAALFAISVTLAAYCCKAVNCCSPVTRMPVITIQAPPTQPREMNETTSEFNYPAEHHAL